MIGLGWEDLITYWSKNDKAFTPEDLASHIKMIVSEQRSRSIPTNPPVLPPSQKALKQLVTQVPEFVVVDAAFLETIDEFDQQERRTRLEREAVGVGNIYSNMKPTSEPAIDKYLIGKRLNS